MHGVKQAQQWLGHFYPATTLRHYVRLTTAAWAKAVAGLDEVTRAALERAEEKVLEDAQLARDNVVALAVGADKSPTSTCIWMARNGEPWDWLGRRQRRAWAP